MEGGQQNTTDSWLERHGAAIDRVARLNEEMLSCDEDARYFAGNLVTTDMQVAALNQLADIQLQTFPQLVTAQEQLPYDELAERVEAADAHLGEIALRREAIAMDEAGIAHDLRSDALTIITRRPQLGQAMHRKVEELLAKYRGEQLAQLDSEQQAAEGTRDKLAAVVAQVGAIALPTLSLIAPEQLKRRGEGLKPAIDAGEEVPPAEHYAAERETDQVRETQAVMEGMLVEEQEGVPAVEYTAVSGQIRTLSDEEWHQMSPGWRFGDCLARHAGEELLDEDIAAEVYGSRDQRSVQMIRSLVSNAQRGVMTPLSERLQQDGLELQMEKRPVERAEGAGRRGPRLRQYIGAFSANQGQEP